MSAMIRRIVQLLLFTLVINAGGWTFNKEAVADVWLDEQHSTTVNDGQLDVSEDSKNDSPQGLCNHWCHIVGHFVGLFSQSASVTPEFANAYAIQRAYAIEIYFPDGRFRPPRLLS